MSLPVFHLLQQKWLRPSLKDPTASFEGRTVLITGANVGIGFEAAVKFVTLGASKVILGVRNLDKGNAAATSIASRTGRKGVLQVSKLDMQDYNSIRTFAKVVHDELDRLDYVILNAGVAQAMFETSPSGWEVDLQVNTLSTVLLALLLLPKLKASRRDGFTPSLILVSSGNHLRTEIRAREACAENLIWHFNERENFSAPRQYDLSKLFLMCALPHLASLAETEGEGEEPATFVIAVCPGATTSDISRGYQTWWSKPLFTLMFALMFKSTEEGSRSYVSGALLEKEGHRRFFQNDAFPP